MTQPLTDGRGNEILADELISLVEALEHEQPYETVAYDYALIKTAAERLRKPVSPVVGREWHAYLYTVPRGEVVGLLYSTPQSHTFPVAALTPQVTTEPK